MNEFLFLFRGGDMSGSPAEMQQRMEKWFAWARELTEKGHLKRPGQPLEPTGKLVQGKQKVVVDGPFAEAKDLIGGYMVLEAEDLAHAVELSKGCPVFDGGGAVEVRPILKLSR
ncbi:YciI family protein [Sorangium sp. So ce726]|uniref:YciI family protein n=1 Tax=Sorangium sp. So ce726 TaxID=3133319 RepID=UPI003F601721